MLVSSSMMKLCPNKPPAELSDWLFDVSLPTSQSAHSVQNPLSLRLQTSVGWVMPCENQALDTWGLMSLTNGYKFKVRPVSVFIRTGVKEASLKPRKIYLGWEDGTHNYQQRGALDAKEDDAEEMIWVVVCQDVAPYGEHRRASIKQHFERRSIKSAAASPCPMKVQLYMKRESWT